MEPTSFLVLLAYSLIGVLAGYLGGFMGVGGGIIYVPALDFLYRHAGVANELAFHLALGTSLATILLTSISATRTHQGFGFICWRCFFWGTVGGAIGSTSSAQLAIGTNPLYLKAAFGLMLLALSAHFFFFHPPERRSEDEKQSAPLFFVVGVAAGFFGSFFGVGGGIVNVPLLVLIAKFNPHRAVGTSSALVVGASLFGALNYAITGLGKTAAVPHTIGFIHWPSWIFLVPTGMIAAHYGALLAKRLNPAPLRRVIAILLCLIGIRYVLVLTFW